MSWLAFTAIVAIVAVSSVTVAVVAIRFGADVKARFRPRAVDFDVANEDREADPPG